MLPEETEGGVRELLAGFRSLGYKNACDKKKGSISEGDGGGGKKMPGRNFCRERVVKGEKR